MAARVKRAAAAGGSLAGLGIARGQVAEMQRSRLIAAAILVIERVGYEGATVAQITERARISRRTFYELFTNREECIAAVLQSAAEQVRGELQDADLVGLAWRERMRRGLWTILCFLDREPALARVLVVESQRGGDPVLAARGAIVRELVTRVDEGQTERTAVGCSELTAEGVLGATLAIVYRDLTRGGRAGDGRAGGGRGEPLTRLFGELLGVILLPYLGATVARREQARPAPAPPAADVSLGSMALAPADPLAGLQMRLTYRTARVLEGIGQQPGASNRQAADYAGIADQGQVSKLLARLERLGLLANHSAGQPRGERNAWQLTPRGQLVTESIRAHTSHKRRAA